MNKSDINRLKIALLHYSCPHVVGGVEEIISQQVTLFTRYGHQIKIIAGEGDIFTKDFPITINPLFSSTNSSVMKVHRDLLEGDNRAGLEKLIDIFSVILNQELTSYDILIAHNVMTMPFNLPLTFAVRDVANTSKVRVISWNHDSIYFYADCPGAYHDEPWNILKTYFPFMNYVCISHQRLKQFRELYGTDAKITVIPDSIDPTNFLGLSAQSQRFVRELELYMADLVMIQPSRLIPRKNIEMGFGVVQAMKRKGIKVRYIVTGIYDPHEQRHVQYYQKLKDKIKKLDITHEVIFITDHKLKNGKRIIPDKKFIHDLYMVADLLFMPSISEGFGIPLLEAGLTKLPVVCSNILPFMEIGNDYICTFSHGEDYDCIADKILKFLGNLATHRFYRRVINNYIGDSIYRVHMRPMFLQMINNM